MNSKIKTLLGVVLFVLLIVSAYFAYNRFKVNNLPENALNPPKVNTGADPTTPSPSVTQTPDSTADADKTQDPNQEADEEQKLAAFDFTVYDPDGNTVKLSDFYGRPIILNFWTTWCPYCVEEMPLFQEKFKQYGDDIQFMMIDAVDGQRETVEMGKKFIEKNKFTFPVFYDTDTIATQTYQAYSLPTSVFIDKDGYIIAYQPGMLTEKMLQTGINLIYQEDD